MIRTGFETLDKALAARLAAKETGAAVVDFKAPTEAQFAKEVAKDMVKMDNMSAETKLVFYIVPVIAVIILLAFILKSCGA
jgi:hypothetical protein